MASPQANLVMVIGETCLQYAPRAIPPHELITMLDLPDPQPAPHLPHTVLPVLPSLGTVIACTRTVDGTRRHQYRLPGIDILDGIGIGSPISAAVTALAGDDGRTAAGHTPLFCAARRADGWHTYSRVHLRPDRIAFIRTSLDPVPTGAGDLDWLPRAVALQAEHAGVLNSHDTAMRPAFAGQEVETKFALPPDTPIWSLTVDLHRRVASGRLPGMVPRLRDDLELWDYRNHLFEVTGPGSESGYVSFMGVEPGVYRVKRKNFPADGLIRAETVTPDVRPDRPLDEYVRQVLHLDARQLPSFRRVRHDVKFESVISGNHYGIFLDRCTLLDFPEETLVQAEVEYLWSRSVLPLDESEILVELDDVTAWTGSVLAQHGMAVEPTFYSKLSFLRDVVARRPELRSSSQPARGGTT
jgi:hypothetical protein